MLFYCMFFCLQVKHLTPPNPNMTSLIALSALSAVTHHYVSAIQQYCVFWEERTRFTVDSPVVKKALADAKICKQSTC
jgi:hypothetical protein